MPGGFVALFIVIVIAAVAMSAVNAGKAREIAERTGEDPGRAMWRLFAARDQRSELRHMEAEADIVEQRRRLDAAQRETNERLRRAEQAAQAAARAAAIQAAAADKPADERPAAERLQELQDLYTKGLVNEDEFSEKRREILGDV